MAEFPFRIVLDTNVLYAGLYSSVGYSHQLLRMILLGKIRIVLSTPMLFEYEDVLKRNHEKLGLNDHDVESILDNLCALADFQDIYFLWRPCLPDPKDDLVLELAVAARVKNIVSFNERDFRPCSRFGIEVASPKKFIQELP